MASLTEPIEIRARRAPTRLVFGPHETNLGRGRRLSAEHVAYYAARAAGGAGVLITEVASVHPSDWPYERAPLAGACEDGWHAVAAACRPYGTVVLAGLGHAGAEGSSAYSQAVLWAPSRVADAVSREAPAEMEDREIAAVVDGFASAARLAMAAGLAGVEVDAGVRSLLRQFHSGVTNQRGDDYGADRLRLTREVLAAVRVAVGREGIVALRLSCDELAPWAGVTPEHAAEQVEALAGGVDVLVAVRGGPYSATAYRPDAHTRPGFNLELCRTIREVAAGRALVVLQGSVVDAGLAQSAVDDGAADLVEMTRAQIADAQLGAKVRDRVPERVRPCVLCNQACLVRDARNPIVSCVVEPRSGYETREPDDSGADAVARDVLIVGAGPAGLECARVLAARGHRVRVADRATKTGGALRTAGEALGRERMVRFAEWLEDECRRHGVQFDLDIEVGATAVRTAIDEGTHVVLATGSRAGERRHGRVGSAGGAPDAEGHPGPEAPAPGDPPAVVDALALLVAGAEDLPDGPILVSDPVGDSAGIAVAEWLHSLGREVSLVTPDQIAGTLLSRTGDLADANVRLQRAGIPRELRSLVRELGGGRAVLEDLWTGQRRAIPCAVLVDCGHRLPEDGLYEEVGGRRAGDCVAPRTVLEAVLEGRRAALEIAADPSPARQPALVAP